MVLLCLVQGPWASSLCIYLGEGRGVHKCMYILWEHIVSLSYRTDVWIFTKLGRDEVFMVPYKCCCFSARSVKGRIQGRAKIGQGGPLLQRTSSSDWKATATNQMHSNDLEACGMKYCYFWFHSEVKFLTRFRHLFGLIVILPCFNAIFVYFLCSKVFNLHLFCIISMFVSGRMLIPV